MNVTVRRVALLLVIALALAAVASALPVGGSRAPVAPHGRTPAAHRAAWPSWAHPVAAVQSAAVAPVVPPEAMRPPAPPSRAITVTHFLPCGAVGSHAPPAAWRAVGNGAPESTLAAITLRVPQPPPRPA